MRILPIAPPLAPHYLILFIPPKPTAFLPPASLLLRPILFPLPFHTARHHPHLLRPYHLPLPLLSCLCLPSLPPLHLFLNQLLPICPSPPIRYRPPFSLHHCPPWPRFPHILHVPFTILLPHLLTSGNPIAFLIPLLPLSLPTHLLLDLPLPNHLPLLDFGLPLPYSKKHIHTSRYHQSKRRQNLPTPFSFRPPKSLTHDHAVALQ